MHKMMKAVVVAASIGFLSTGFAAERPVAPGAATTQSTQSPSTTQTTPTNDQVLTGGSANIAPQTTSTQSTLSHDHGHADEDMD